jgi:hypothetical protein
MSLAHTEQRAFHRKRSHQWIDARSLALARAVAAKISRNPSLLDIARGNLQRWRGTVQPWPGALEEWEQILAEPSVDAIVSALVADDEEGRRRRQSSPFAGVLSGEERGAIFR